MNVIEGKAPFADFGTGLGQGLAALANHKLNEITRNKQQAQTAQGLQGLFPNAKAQELHAWSQLSPELLNTVVKNKLQEPGNQAYAKLLQQAYSSGEGSEQSDIPLGGINSKQATDLLKFQADLDQRREVNQLKKQQLIEGENKPYLADLDKKYTASTDIHSLALELKQLLDTGKVLTGLTGKYTPELLQNTETQAFDAKSKELATYLAGQGRGVATNFKIRLAQESKPLLSHKKETQEKLLGDVIEKTGKVLKEDKARQAVLARNKGLQPANIKHLIQDELKKPQYKLNLPDALYDDGQEVKEGDLIEERGIKFLRRNGEWEKV